MFVKVVGRTWNVRMQRQLVVPAPPFGLVWKQDSEADGGIRSWRRLVRLSHLIGIVNAIHIHRIVDCVVVGFDRVGVQQI